MSKNAKAPELARLLYTRILSGKIREGEKLPTVQELMQQYDTTKATVTKAYDLLENKQILDRKPGKGVYLKEKPGRNFGIVYDREPLSSPLTFHAAFAKAFTERCRTVGYGFHNYGKVSNDQEAEAFVKQISHSPVDTLLVSSRFLAENRVKYLDDLLVFPIGLHTYRKLMTTVTPNGETLAFKGTMSLFAEGAEQVFLFRNPFTFEWRKNPDDTTLFSFKEALRCNGVLFDPAFYRRVSVSEESAYQEVKTLLPQLRAKKTGIVSSDSVFTAGILRAVKQWNLPVKVVTHANHADDFKEYRKNVIVFAAPLAEMIDRIFELSEIRIHGTGSSLTNETFSLVRQQ